MEQRKDIMTGIIRILIQFIVGSIFLAIAGYILSFVIDIIGRILLQEYKSSPSCIYDQ